MTKEEVIISLGLDNASLKTGLVGSDYLIQNSVRATMNSLKNLVRINFVTMAFQAVELWDKATKSIAEGYYASIYKVHDLLITQFTERFKKLVGLESNSRKDLAKAERDFKFHVADEPAKEEMLRSELALNKVKQENLELEMRKNKEKLKELESFSKSDAFQKLKLELLKQEAEDTIKLNKLKADGLDIEAKQFDLTIKREDTEKRRQDREAQRIKTFRDRLEDQRRALSESSGNLYDAQKGRNQFTLEELAGADFMKGTWMGNRANWILDLQRWSKENSMLGFHDKAAMQRNKADELFADLQKRNPMLKDPMKDVKDALLKNYEKLAEIKSEGIPIDPLD